MRNFILIVTLVALQSCNNEIQQKEPFKSLLKTCDEVNFNFYNGGDTLHFQTNDTLGIRYLAENIKGVTETISDTCKPIGSIFYRAKGDTLLRGEFAIMPTSTKNDCAYISYNYQNSSYKNKLSEKIYQLLTQMYPKPSTDSSRQVTDSAQLVNDSARALPDTAKK